MFLGCMAGQGLFAVTANNASGIASGAGSSGTVTAVGSSSVANAIGSVSYSWSLVSSSQGAAQSISANGTTAAPTFRATGVVNGTPSIATWRVTATDAAGREDTDDCTVTLTFNSIS